MNRLLRTIRLLVNNLSNESLAGQKAINAKTPSGVVYDLYEPAQAAVATHILIYGLDLAGEKDARRIARPRRRMPSSIASGAWVMKFKRRQLSSAIPGG